MIPQDRLGRYNTDGSYAVKPTVDINGFPFDTMLSTARVGNDYFVVLPVNFSNHSLLEQVRAEIGKGKVNLTLPKKEELE